MLCRRRLASYVSYIPLPVVAGYLAYVGYFCFAAGMAQGTALAIGSPATWLLLVQHPEALPKAAATLACACVIFWAVHFWKSAAALPAVLTIVPVLWYTAMWVVTAVAGVPWSAAVQWLADHDWTAAVPDSAGQSVAEVRRRQC